MPVHPHWFWTGSIFQSWDELWQAVGVYRSNPASFPEFGDWSALLDSLDPFQDGRAAERIGVYVSWLAHGLSDGLPREQVLKQARQRYVDRWGEDKVVCLKFEGERSPRQGELAGDISKR